jgi:hypothetical protein
MCFFKRRNVFMHIFSLKEVIQNKIKT